MLFQQVNAHGEMVVMNDDKKADELASETEVKGERGFLKFRVLNLRLLFWRRFLRDIFRQELECC